MLPTLLEIPFFGHHIPIHSYGLMIAIGFLVALYFIRRDAVKFGIDPEVVANMAFWGLLLGIAGTRILHIILYPEYYSWSDPLGWVALWKGGLVFQGGPPVVAVFCYFYLRGHHQPTWKTGDVIFPYLALGHAFGRMGCFLNGCCYGKRTDGFPGLCFRRIPFDLDKRPIGSPPFLEYYGYDDTTHLWSPAVHPTQLYSVVALVTICLLLLLLRKKWHPYPGFVMPMYFIFYGTYRFFVEFIRGDNNPTHLGTFSDQQVIALLMLVVGIALYFILQHVQTKKARADKT